MSGLRDYSMVFKHKDCLHEIDGDSVNMKFESNKKYVFIHGYNGCPHCRNMKATTIPSVCDVKPDDVEIVFNEVTTKAGREMVNKLGVNVGPVPDPLNVCTIDDKGKWNCKREDSPGYRPAERYINELKSMGVDGWKL